MAKAAFLDRDGVIGRDKGCAHRPEDVDLLPGAAQGLLALQQAGYLQMVTNQSGIARRLFSEADYQGFTAAVGARLLAQGDCLTQVCHCPHQDDMSSAQPMHLCDCRNPRSGMLFCAMREHDIAVADSVMVGDRLSDMQPGRAEGVGRCYLFADTPTAALGPIAPNATSSSLADCAMHIAPPAMAFVPTAT